MNVFSILNGSDDLTGLRLPAVIAFEIFKLVK